MLVLKFEPMIKRHFLSQLLLETLMKSNYLKKTCTLKIKYYYG